MVTPRLLAYAGVDIAKQAVDVTGLDGDFGLTHLEAGRPAQLPDRPQQVCCRTWAPGWAGGALSTTADNIVTGESSDLSMSGMSVGASGGVQMFLSPKLALDGGVSLGVGQDGQHQGGRREAGLGHAGQHDHDPAPLRRELVSLTAPSPRSTLPPLSPGDPDMGSSGASPSAASSSRRRL